MYTCVVCSQYAPPLSQWTSGSYRTQVPLIPGKDNRDSHKHKHTIMHPAVDVHKFTSCRTLLNKKLVKCNRHLISQCYQATLRFLVLHQYIHATHTVGPLHSPALWPSGMSASGPPLSCTACMGGAGKWRGWCA